MFLVLLPVLGLTSWLDGSLIYYSRSFGISARWGGFRGLFQTVKNGSKELCLYLLHAPPPQIDTTLELRKAFFANYRSHSIANCRDRSTVILGDLNMTPFSSTYRLLTTGDLSLQDTAWGHGFHPTWFFPPIPLLRTTIDYILYRGDLCLLRQEIFDNLDSDHSAIFAEFANCHPADR